MVALRRVVIRISGDDPTLRVYIARALTRSIKLNTKVLNIIT